MVVISWRSTPTTLHFTWVGVPQNIFILAQLKTGRWAIFLLTSGHRHSVHKNPVARALCTGQRHAVDTWQRWYSCRRKQHIACFNCFCSFTDHSSRMLSYAPRSTPLWLSVTLSNGILQHKGITLATGVCFNISPILLLKIVYSISRLTCFRVTCHCTYTVRQQTVVSIATIERASIARGTLTAQKQSIARDLVWQQQWRQSRRVNILHRLLSLVYISCFGEG